MSTPATRDSLSLLDIEDGLRELLETRVDAKTTEDVELFHTALDAYLEARIAKVDGIRGLVKFADMTIASAKEEAARQRDRAAAWEALRDHVKDRCLWIMQRLGKKKLEGHTGSLSVKKNGSVQPLKITDPTMIPDELCRMVGWIRADLWFGMVRGDKSADPDWHMDRLDLARVPNNEAIREALGKPCETCYGTGYFKGTSTTKCTDCDGTAKARVPGAYLEPRGEHLEVR